MSLHDRLTVDRRPEPFCWNQHAVAAPAKTTVPRPRLGVRWGLRYDRGGAQGRRTLCGGHVAGLRTGAIISKVGNLTEGPRG
jgi:hypothetical protein